MTSSFPSEDSVAQLFLFGCLNIFWNFINQYCVYIISTLLSHLNLPMCHNTLSSSWYFYNYCYVSVLINITLWVVIVVWIILCVQNISNCIIFTRHNRWIKFLFLITQLRLNTSIIFKSRSSLFYMNHSSEIKVNESYMWK